MSELGKTFESVAALMRLGLEEREAPAAGKRVEDRGCRVSPSCRRAQQDGLRLVSGLRLAVLHDRVQPKDGVKHFRDCPLYIAVGRP